MFGKQRDLSDVIGVMCQLAVDRFANCVFLTANFDGFFKIFDAQIFQSFEQHAPIFFPIFHQTFAGFGLEIDKFRIAETVGFFAVGS